MELGSERLNNEPTDTRKNSSPEQDSNVLINERVKKLRQLRERGIDPYPHQFNRSYLMGEIVDKFKDDLDRNQETEKRVKLGGRIMAFRDMGKASFLDLKDGSGTLQGYTNIDLLGEDAYELLKNLDVGDFIGIEGNIFTTRRGELSVKIDDFTLLSKSIRPLPEKWHGLQDVEKRHRQRSMDILTNDEVKERFIARSKLVARFREVLNDMGFLEVETPIMQPTPGGASAEPFVTHHNALDQDLYLRIAPELYLKRLVVGGMEKVYELGKSFRNEGISSEHNPEFTTVEIYQAYADYRDAMNLTRKLIVEGTKAALGSLKVSCNGNTIDLSPPWDEITLTGSVEEYTDLEIQDHSREEIIAQAKRNGVALPENLEEMNRGQLIEKLFEVYVEENLIQPTFVTEYPKDISPLSKRKRNGDESLTERFEAFIGQHEIVNAFSELNDPQEQNKRFREQQKRTGEPPDVDFLRALEYGLPPTAGTGIGIDRLMMAITDADSIRDVILFPTLKRKEQS